MCSSLMSIILSQFIVGSLAAAMPVDEELYEGSQCVLENGELGICKKLPDCALRLEEVRNGQRNGNSAGRCGFENFTEIVCCPVNITDKIGTRPADIACQQYDNEIMIDKVKANEISFHIFGGTEAQSGEFPYMVALGYENDEIGEDAPAIKYSCGGTLISSQYVLTAAHCVNNVNGNVPIEVRLGNEDIRSTSQNAQRIPISDIISHPRYKRSTNYDDMAILKLKNKVQFTNTVRPICLQTKSLDKIESKSNMSFVVIGWGSTSFDNDGSTKLMRTPSLSLVNREECDKSYRGFLKLPHGLDENMICALDTNRSRQADACQGDSGGPLLMLSQSGDSIIGVTAFGQSCGGPVPGVYTAIYSYLDWIEKQVWPSENN